MHGLSRALLKLTRQPSVSISPPISPAPTSPQKTLSVSKTSKPSPQTKIYKTPPLTRKSNKHALNTTSLDTTAPPQQTLNQCTIPSPIPRQEPRFFSIYTSQNKVFVQTGNGRRINQTARCRTCHKLCRWRGYLLRGG